MSDYISRGDVIAILERIDKWAIENKGHPLLGITTACIEVENIPAADVAPVKHGRWTNPRYGVMAVLTKMCSCCGFINNSSGEWNYCPNCGARMDGDADAEK